MLADLNGLSWGSLSSILPMMGVPIHHSTSGTLACRNSVDPQLTAFVNWELGVSAEPIEGGEPKTATALDGIAVRSKSSSWTTVRP